MIFNCYQCDTVAPLFADSRCGKCTGIEPDTGRLPDEGNPIHHSEGQWYFLDETWANRMGPYSSRAEAKTAMAAYVEYLYRPYTLTC